MKLVSTKFVLVTAIALVGSPLMAQHASAPALPTTGQPVQTIMIRARKYEFIPAEISLHEDQTVKLEFTSEDVEHSLKVPGLGINSIMKKGKVTVVEITPTKLGTFKGKCGKFCGFGHGKMHFLVHVVQ
jgi:cytochrome c oxidase subunit 2